MEIAQAEPLNNEIEQTLRCPQHPDTTAELFCEKCNEVACTRCLGKGNRHFKHSLSGLEGANEVAREQLNLIRFNVGHSMTALQHGNREIRQCQKRVSSRAGELLGQINSRINRIVDDLRQVSTALTIAVQQRGQQQHRKICSRGNKRLRMHTSRCCAQLMEQTKNLLARETVVHLKSDVQMAERTRDYILELGQLTNWQSTEVGKLVDDDWLKELETLSNFVRRLRDSADELVVQSDRRTCASEERQVTLFAEISSLKEQLRKMQLDKDFAEQLRAAAENELKKAKSDCDELKKQIADLHTTSDSSEAKKSDLMRRKETVSWYWNNSARAEQQLEDLVATYQLNLEASLTEVKSVKEALRKMTAEKMALENRHSMRQSELQNEVDKLKQQVTSLTNQLSEAHTLIQNVLEEKTMSQEAPLESRQPVPINSTLPNFLQAKLGAQERRQTIGNCTAVVSNPFPSHRNGNASMTAAQQAIQAQASRKEGVLHPGIRCDGCQEEPIRGIRYKCRVCPNFDFCSSCKSNKSHGHTMLVFEKPVNFSSPDQVHVWSKCDGCACIIRGTRYKCMVCKNFDLCERCKANQLHIHHDLKVIRNPQ